MPQLISLIAFSSSVASVSSTMRDVRAAFAASTTCRTIGRPAIAWMSFVDCECIRLPSPAARTMAQTSRLREAREGRLEVRPVIAGPEAGDTGRKEKGPEAGRAGETLVGEAGRPGTVRRGLNAPEAGPLPCAPG